MIICYQTIITSNLSLQTLKLDYGFNKPFWIYGSKHSLGLMAPSTLYTKTFLDKVSKLFPLDYGFKALPQNKKNEERVMLERVKQPHFILVYLICHSFIIIFRVGTPRSVTHEIFSKH